MNALDNALWRANEIFLEDLSSELDNELGELLPQLVEAGWINEEPWGDDSDWFLWRFTEAGTKRLEELEAARNPNRPITTTLPGPTKH